MTASFNQVEDIMTVAPVIPVLTINRLDHALPLAKALAAGGLSVLEVTLRTPVALAAIATIAQHLPNVVVGAGTVLTPIQMRDVHGAGGVFCVSPGATPALIEAARQQNMKFLPGVSTASEVMTLLEQDIRFLKFFPAEPAGGTAMLKSLASPLPEARFCPTGGIRPSNARDYLSLANVLCVGGSWVCPAEAVERGEWDHISQLAQEAVQLGASPSPS